MARYTIDGIKYPSVTTVLGLLGKGDALIQWAVNVSLEAKDKLGWKKYRDNTADIGSELHRLIETYINILLKDEEPIVKLLLKDASDNLKQMFYQFLVWENKNVTKYFESEKSIVHKDYCYAGTCDFVYLNKDNEVCMVDIKTSNAIYPEHKTQVNAYMIARNSMQGNYNILFNVKNKEWEKDIFYPAFSIKKAEILLIARDDFYLKHEDCTDVYKTQAFLYLLSYYYTIAKRRMNNKRCRK
jgi:hypothetical protein